jgi:CDP-glucose 4,6-dehydratase
MEKLVRMIEGLEQCYRGKKVFLTGHTGFKGAWLLKTLHLLGAEVRGYALAPQHDNDLFNLINGQTICDSVIDDLRNKESLITSVLDFQPDFIFHLAAQPLVRLSYEIPSETFHVNAVGTANLLDAVRLLEKKCSIILITTDKVYHNNEWIYPYRENDRLGGLDPYSASKACAELIIDSYRNSFFNWSSYDRHKKGIAVGRAGNVIGGGDWSKDRLIPDIAKAFGSGKKVSIRNPNSVRPWQHVLEPVIGYLLLGKKLEEQPVNYSQAFNFGPNSDDALSVREMVELVVREWDGNAYEILMADDQPHEASLLMLDIAKAIKELKWKPRLTAQMAIKDTIDWYKVYYSHPEKINEMTSEQIINFISE